MTALEEVAPQVGRWSDNIGLSSVAGVAIGIKKPSETTIDAAHGSVAPIIEDRSGAQKHPNVRTCLNRHPRFVFHFTPTSRSWLNAVETFFAKFIKRRLKRGVFRSIVKL